MIDMLKFEFRKLVRMKSLYVCAAVVLFQIFFTTLISSLSNVLYEWTESNKPSMWDAVITASSVVPIPLAVFVSLYAVSDFGGGTIKNIIAKGYSRTSIFLSQLIAVVAVSVAFFIVSELSAMAFGAAFLTRVKPAKGLWGSVFLQLPVIIAYGGFFFGLSSLFKGVGGAIATTVLSHILVFPLTFSLVSIIVIRYCKNTKINILNYWLGEMLQNATSLNLTDKTIAITLVGSAIYFVIFVAIGYLIARRREV